MRAKTLLCVGVCISLIQHPLAQSQQPKPLPSDQDQQSQIQNQQQQQAEDPLADNSQAVAAAIQTEGTEAAAKDPAFGCFDSCNRKCLEGHPMKCVFVAGSIPVCPPEAATPCKDNCHKFCDCLAFCGCDQPEGTGCQDSCSSHCSKLKDAGMPPAQDKDKDGNGNDGDGGNSSSGGGGGSDNNSNSGGIGGDGGNGSGEAEKDNDLGTMKVHYHSGETTKQAP